MIQKNKHTKAGLFLSIAAICLSCSRAVFFKSNKKHNSNALAKAEWLIGAWMNEANGIKSFESWIKVNDSLFSATSYMLKGNDTLTQEQIQLKQIGKKIFYIPTVGE